MGFFYKKREAHLIFWDIEILRLKNAHVFGHKGKE